MNETVNVKTGAPWYLECFSCKGVFIDYYGEAPPLVYTNVWPEVEAGLLRHVDGRVIQHWELGRCDTCGATVAQQDPLDPLVFYHPSRFRRHGLTDTNHASSAFQTVGAFEQAWATQRGMTVEQAHADGWFGYKVLHCSEDDCNGWHMGTQDTYDMEKQLAAMIQQWKRADQ